MAKRDENNKKFVESQNTKKEVSEKVDIKALKEILEAAEWKRFYGKR